MWLLLYFSILVPILSSPATFPSEIYSASTSASDHSILPNDVPSLDQNISSAQPFSRTSLSSSLRSRRETNQSNSQKSGDVNPSLVDLEKQLKVAEEDASLKKKIANLTEEELHRKEKEVSQAEWDRSEKYSKWFLLHLNALDKDRHWYKAKENMERAQKDQAFEREDLEMYDRLITTNEKRVESKENKIRSIPEKREELKREREKLDQAQKRVTDFENDLNRVAEEFTKNSTDLWRAQVELENDPRAQQDVARHTDNAQKIAERGIEECRVLMQASKERGEHSFRISFKLDGYSDENIEDMTMLLQKGLDKAKEDLESTKESKKGTERKMKELKEIEAANALIVAAGPPADSIEPRRIADEAESVHNVAQENKKRIQNEVIQLKKALSLTRSFYADAQLKADALKESYERAKDESQGQEQAAD